MASLAGIKMSNYCCSWSCIYGCLSVKRLYGLSTVGGKSMSSCYFALLGCVKTIIPIVKVDRHITHSSTSSSNEILSYLYERVFEGFCKICLFHQITRHEFKAILMIGSRIRSIQKTLPFHSKVQWLSQNKFLIRLFELRHEMKVWFENHFFRFLFKFNDHEWL